MPNKKFGGAPHLRVRLPVSFKIRFTEWLFDWAERQKPASDANWFLFQLQLHRQSERKLAESFYNFTRPPDKTEIAFLGFRLVELFHYEDFDKVRSGLFSLFPDLERSNNGFIRTFEKNNDALTTMWWSPVGTLYGDVRPLMGNTVVRQIASLNSYIKYVHVEVQKILPSLLVVYFDVQLKDEATTKLVELHSQKYLSRSTIENIYFGKYPLVGIASGTPNGVLTEKISGFIFDIRESVEKTIKPYIQGYFLSKARGKLYLPSIEFFSIAGTDHNRRSFTNWVEKSRLWWASYGFNFFQRQFFGNKEVKFAWHDSIRQDAIENGNRIVVIPEKFSEENTSLWHKLGYYYRDITPLVLIVEFLDDLLGTLERMRRQIFDALGRKDYNPSHYIKIYQEFQVLVRVFQRLSLEYKQSFIHNSFVDISDLVEIDINKKRGKSTQVEKITFSMNARERIDFLNKLLSDHIEFIDNALARHIGFLNTDAVYRLQRATYFLAIIATFIGVIGILVNFSELKAFFAEFINVIRCFLGKL